MLAGQHYAVLASAEGRNRMSTHPDHNIASPRALNPQQEQCAANMIFNVFSLNPMWAVCLVDDLQSKSIPLPTTTTKS